MRVSQILKAKSQGGVITISPQASVSDAAVLLSEKRIGSVVVTSNGTHAEGILSERDIVRELGKRGSSCLQGLVSDMMTRDPVTCTSEDTADATCRSSRTAP